MLIYAILDRATLLGLRFRLAMEQQRFDERKRAGTVRIEDLLRLGHVSGDLIRFRHYMDRTYGPRHDAHRPTGR